MVRVENVKNAAQQPLEQIRPVVLKAWQQDWLTNQARVSAEQIRDEAKKGTPLSALATKKNLTFIKSRQITRFNAQSDQSLPLHYRGSLQSQNRRSFRWTDNGGTCRS